MIDLLVKNGFILTLDPAGTTHERGVLAIDSGRILAIGPQAQIIVHAGVASYLKNRKHRQGSGLPLQAQRPALRRA